MGYPETKFLAKLSEQLGLYSQLQFEYGAKGIEPALKKIRNAMKSGLSELRRLSPNAGLAAKEPNALPAIKRLRPVGPRKLWNAFDSKVYTDRLEGAMLGRFAGCTLGAPVEFWTIEKMENLAKENKQAFPPTEYWNYVPNPYEKRYEVGVRETYALKKMNGVPVDDDIIYTLLGLLVVEEYGSGFTLAQIGKAWLKHLPIACTAERVALDNLKAGVSATRAGARDNPYCEWIGAYIRADPWAYMAPAWPEFAAEMAYRDAYLSHRRNGVYGEMYFAAAISAAFALNDPVEALHVGLTEIPRDCATAKAVRWALSVAPKIKNYRQAYEAMSRKFQGMHRVHTLNNACLTIWAVTIGGKDFDRVIGEATAMGMDNDCNAATAGSLVGAIVGRRGIPKKWTTPFRNTVHSYLTTCKKFRLDDLQRRFARQAERVYREA